MLEDPLRVLIVEARAYDQIADELLAGAQAALTAAGAEFEVVSVPGALEIPAAIALAEEGGHRAVLLRRNHDPRSRSRNSRHHRPRLLPLPGDRAHKCRRGALPLVIRPRAVR